VTVAGVAAVEHKGRVTLEFDGRVYDKRFVLRYPKGAGAWNGALVVGAHGGTGGQAVDENGTVVGNSETALDDVIGDPAIERRFAYASVDRDGIGGTREGLRLTHNFTEAVQAQIGERLGRRPDRTYLVGLSMGGGLSRYAAEEHPRDQAYTGILLIAGAGGDIRTRLDRQAEAPRLWPGIDPRRHPEVPDTDPDVQAYAKLVGTPVGARALWPYAANGATTAALARSLEQYGLTGLGENQLSSFRVAERASDEAFVERLKADDTTGELTTRVIEVAGTFDDLVRREILAYEQKVALANRGDRHRLYQVAGVWHISGDDDAMPSFIYGAKRMGLDASVLAAMKRSPSYLPTVREAFDALVTWVAKGTVPPPSQTVEPGKRLASAGP